MYGRVHASKSLVGSWGSKHIASVFTVLNPAVLRSSIVSVVWPSACASTSAAILAVSGAFLRISIPCILNGVPGIRAHWTSRVLRASRSASVSSFCRRTEATVSRRFLTCASTSGLPDCTASVSNPGIRSLSTCSGLLCILFSWSCRSGVLG